MKRKILTTLMIGICALSFVGCGNQNKWDNENVSVDYGEVDENVTVDLGGWDTEMLIDEYVKFIDYNPNSTIYTYEELANAYNSIGWSSKLDPGYEAEEITAAYKYDLITADGTYVTITTDKNMQVLSVKSSYCGLNNKGDGGLYETLSHLMPFYYASIPNINKSSINSVYIEVIDMIENGTGHVYTKKVGAYDCNITYEAEFDTFTMIIINQKAFE